MTIGFFSTYPKEIVYIFRVTFTKEKETAQSELNRAQGMLSNEKFVSKAPEKLIAGEKEKVAKYSEMIEKIDERLKELNNQ